MNKLTAFQKRMIVVGIGLLIILFGALQATFKLDIFIKYKRVVDDVIFILMVFAAMLLFSNRKTRSEPEAPNEAVEPEKKEETTGGQTKDL
jgi:intracellular septation protein A